MDLKKIGLFLFVFALCLFNCSKRDGNDNSDMAADSLTVFPLRYSDLKGLVPLGNLNPPGHTLPTGHTYLYFKDPTIKVPLLSPGNIQLIEVEINLREVGDSVVGQDYSLKFDLGKYYLNFGHVTDLADDIKAAMESASTSGNKRCKEPYDLNGTTFTDCVVKIDHFKVTAGQEIGKGGGQPGQYGLDMGAQIKGEEPPFNAVCPFIYYKRTVYEDIRQKFSNYDGSIPRTTEPLCGEYNYEIPNTASGIWKKQGLPLYPEDMQVALVKDNIQPEFPVFSISNSLTGLSSGVYYFDVQNTGVVNRKFEDVKSDGNTYCYDLKYKNTSTILGSMILKMSDDTTLDLEYRPDYDCSVNTDYTFSNKKVRYVKPQEVLDWLKQ
ncbi:hypothetical protein [Pseudozobellia thermophila]|uniref:Uncharacterized protein n=1 Tax=Pseudozobellia thermophila TaxID=192903 RepID=A0A1M6HWM7_9FLAO|nr:hypothetical protein [Pseudozobellia thermophila]SHJ26642.1 hypothetical protein SAMN04488513_103218 [Pseudozobellia thermophila]